MSYWTQNEMSSDYYLTNRIAACAAQEGIPDADQWTYDNRRTWAAAPGWDAAWDSYLVSNPQPEDEKDPMPGLAGLKRAKYEEHLRLKALDEEMAARTPADILNPQLKTPQSPLANFPQPEPEMEEPPPPWVPPGLNEAVISDGMILSQVQSMNV